MHHWSICVIYLQKYSFLWYLQTRKYDLFQKGVKRMVIFTPGDRGWLFNQYWLLLSPYSTSAKMDENHTIFTSYSDFSISLSIMKKKSRLKSKRVCIDFTLSEKYWMRESIQRLCDFLQYGTVITFRWSRECRKSPGRRDCLLWPPSYLLQFFLFTCFPWYILFP